MTKKEYKSIEICIFQIRWKDSFQPIAMEAFKSYRSIRNKSSRVTKSSPLTADKFARLKLSADDYVWMSRYQIQQCDHFIEWNPKCEDEVSRGFDNIAGIDRRKIPHHLFDFKIFVVENRKCLISNPLSTKQSVKSLRDQTL